MRLRIPPGCFTKSLAPAGAFSAAVLIFADMERFEDRKCVWVVVDFGAVADVCV